MRIVSLLPSATEVVFALGLGDQLVGVSSECDHPPAARAKPVVSDTTLAAGLDPAAIDRLVTRRAAAGASLYRLDEEALRRLAPDLVLTQDLCAVCAIEVGDVTEALEYLGCTADVLTLDPRSLDDVLDSIVEIGRACRTPARAVEITTRLRRRVDRVVTAVAGAPRPRTLVLEWTDPPYNAGHWIPDMVTAAGGEPLLARAREPSARIGWRDVTRARPEVVIVSPCGYDLAGARALARAPGLVDAIAPTPAARAHRVHAVNASAYFVRPGPRVVDGVEILAGLLHPERWPRPRPPRAKPTRVPSSTRLPGRP